MSRRLSKQRRKQKQLRFQARKRFLIPLWSRSGGRCELCGVKVVLMRTIPPEDRLEETRDGHLVYRDEAGSAVRMPIGTIEHMDGLRSHEDNVLCRMLLACWACNQKRNREKCHGVG